MCQRPLTGPHWKSHRPAVPCILSDCAWRCLGEEQAITHWLTRGQRYILNFLGGSCEFQFRVAYKEYIFKLSMHSTLQCPNLLWSWQRWWWVESVMYPAPRNWQQWQPNIPATHTSFPSHHYTNPVITILYIIITLYSTTILPSLYYKHIYIYIYQA